MPSNTQSTNFRGGLTAQSTITGKQEYLTSTGGALNINGGGSGGGSTQYASGITTPSPVIGNALIYDNGGTLQNVSVANPLPVNASVTITGVATSANQTNASQKTQIVDGSGNIIGSTSNSLNTNITNSSIAVTGTFWQTTQPISGTITANAGTNLNTSLLALESGGNLATIATNTTALNNAQGSITSGQTGPLILAAVTTAAPTYTATQSSPLTLTVNGSLRTSVTSLSALVAGSAIIGKVGIDQTTPGTTNGVQVNAALPAGTNVIGHVITDTGSTTVVSGTTTVKEVRSTAPAQTSVSVSNTTTSILVSNTNRLGFTVYNEGTAICYLKLGSTASTTSYTIQVASGGYYECPFNYTGAVDGITSSSTAQLRVTELT